jgi:hypothetical protein
MAEFVAEVKADAVRMLAHGIYHLGQKYDVLGAEEFCGKSVEASVTVENIGLRTLVYLQAVTAFGKLPV